MSVATEPLRTVPHSLEARPLVVAKPGSTRIAGLDGLRAIAVIAVIVYHYVPTAAPGGYLGVDLFFVISGFLITSLLIREREATGRIGFGGFWTRRARRLLPALFAMILVTSAAALAIGGEVLVGIGGQLLGAVTFSHNWFGIAAGSDYFQSTSPELYRNLWSLAVEEQFYLIWPVLVVALLVIRSRRLRFWIVMALAVASAVWMMALAVSGADPTRVYFGSDSHSLGLLLGAAVALSAGALTPYVPAATRWRRAGRAVVRWTFFVPLLALLAIAMVRFDDASAVLTSLSVLFFSILAATVIAVVLQLPSAGRALDVAPLRAIGERSYGLYLWHWPVLVLLMAWLRPDPANALLMIAVTVAALGLTIGAAVLSHRWVETPVRIFGLRGSLAQVFGSARRGRVGSWVAIAVVPLLVSSLVAGAVLAVLAEPRESLAAERIRDGQAIQAAAAQAAEKAAERPARATTPPRAAAVLPRPTGEHVTVIGDSVLLASLPELQNALPGLMPDARVSRQMSVAPELLRRLEDEGALRDYVVVALGTNGGFDPAVLPSIRDVVGPDRKLVFVTAFADRSWTPGVNAALTRYVANDPDAAIADWSDAIAGHTDLLAWDNIHPGAAGGRIFSATVVDALDRLYTIPPEVAEQLIPDEVPGTDLILR